VNRSRFLVSSAGALTVFAIAPPARADSDVVDIALTAAPLPFQLPGGHVVPLLAYNASVPGPVMRVTRGQRIRVRYRNATNIPTSVHWHGQVIPNAMDGVAGITQPPVLPGGSFVYEFEPAPSGTRWYHDHGFHMGMIRGLFGLFVIEDPSDEPADAEYALVFHDISDMSSVDAALRGTSAAPDIDPPGSPERAEMPSMPGMPGMASTTPMGDMLAYRAHLVNGGIYPHARSLPVRVGQRIRLRVLNASAADTRYVRFAGHALRVTHADGNRLPEAMSVDALRVGAGERYDAYVEIAKPGAWLLQGISADPLIAQQAVAFATDARYLATPQSSPQTLEGVRFFTYELAGGSSARIDDRGVTKRVSLRITGGTYGDPRWMIDGGVWPHTPKISVHRGDRVLVKFTNDSDMEHPMHLHGHTFRLVEVGGTPLLRPLAKDVSLVPGAHGTSTWIFDAKAFPGRWLLHCHNEIHMMAGLMTEVVYS
jgi:FtsP/CotA-like multicopper oxidase with cupredoxin domain